MKFKKFISRAHWILSSQFGIDPIAIYRSLCAFPHFIYQAFVFRQRFDGMIEWQPCLQDRYAEAGSTKNEYFWQDLIVAQWIYQANPVRHIDFGSRIDGFVAHVASYRKIEVIDIRPSTSMIPNVKYITRDIMNLTNGSILNLSKDSSGFYCDSISCLHVLEHIGLGRYGDNIDPYGYERAFSNIVQFLSEGGSFYLSTPVGTERVNFNSNWVFSPYKLMSLAEKSNLCLENLCIHTSKDGLKVIPRKDFDLTLARVSSDYYSLAIFHFRLLPQSPPKT